MVSLFKSWVFWPWVFRTLGILKLGISGWGNLGLGNLEWNRFRKIFGLNIYLRNFCVRGAKFKNYQAFPKKRFSFEIFQIKKPSQFATGEALVRILFRIRIENYPNCHLSDHSHYIAHELLRSNPCTKVGIMWMVSRSL